LERQLKVKQNTDLKCRVKVGEQRAETGERAVPRAKYIRGDIGEYTKIKKDLEYEK
jgi:hypothetical protein